MCTTNDEGITSAIQSAAPARRESTTAAIVRLLGECARLRASDWRLLAAAAAAQLAIASALRVSPLAAVRRRAGRARPIVRAIAHGSDDRVVWAILATGRRLGRWSTCLVRALAAELIVDDPSGLVLTIGVRRAGGAVDAHAWLARGDRVLVGAAPDGYAPLVEWSHLSV